MQISLIKEFGSYFIVQWIHE
jgi:hypothetical protein